uniref:Uncharacterized protein n=1 Tax=Caenorhabditis japonica TaxID=281687 RepID=A0A8R1DSS9_CAEJA
MFRREVPPPPRTDQESDADADESSAEEENTDPVRKRDNNWIEKQNKDTDDEVFHSEDQNEENFEVIKEESIVKPTPGLRNRRVSYGKIPIPPVSLTIEDIQKAAKISRENENPVEKLEKRKPVDPRRSSVSVDVFKGFRDPHDKENIPAKNKTVYVEGPTGKFNEMKKGMFWGKLSIHQNSQKNVGDDDDEDSVIPYLLRAPGIAFRTQRAYNQVANIIQGFLAGITVMLAIFSFNLDPDVLLSGYRVMSLPIHAAFYVAFTVGLVSAIDRTGIYELSHILSKDRLKNAIYNNGLFTIIVWFLGLVATLLCIQLESQLTFAPTETPDFKIVEQWRIFNVFRALTAALGFLLLAFKPDSDTMAKELKTAIYDQLDIVSSEGEKKEVILTAMKII